MNNHFNFTDLKVKTIFVKVLLLEYDEVLLSITGAE